MAQYRVLKYLRIGAQPHWPGEVIELTELQARDINRDEPGTVDQEFPLPFAEGDETRAMEAPPNDRMARKMKIRTGSET